MAQWFPKSPPPGVVLAEHPDGKFELSQAAKKAGWQKGIVLMDIKGPEDYPEDFKRQDIAAMNVLARMLVEKHPPGTQVLLKAVVTSYIRQLKSSCFKMASFALGVFLLYASKARRQTVVIIRKSLFVSQT